MSKYDAFRGAFITYEGGEGSGKTTQIKLHVDDFLNHGLDVILTREPGGTIYYGKEIRKLLLTAPPAGVDEKLSELSELLLYAADRAQHVETLIRPALFSGKTVISDRFFDSTKAYQGYGRGIHMNAIEQIMRIATSGIDQNHRLKPDLTLYLDIDPAIGIPRARSRMNDHDHAKKEDRFEREEIEFHRKVRAGFLDMARKEPDRFRVIDAEPGIEAVRAQIVKTLDDFANNRR